jgi:catechol-2,3-dioxygenase
MKTLFETKSRTEATNAFRLPDDTHVCCVHLRTPDLARALDFYQRVIGFKLIERGESKASLSAKGARAHLAGLQ